MEDKKLTGLWSWPVKRFSFVCLNLGLRKIEGGGGGLGVLWYEHSKDAYLDKKSIIIKEKYLLINAEYEK